MLALDQGDVWSWDSFHFRNGGILKQPATLTCPRSGEHDFAIIQAPRKCVDGCLAHKAYSPTAGIAMITFALQKKNAVGTTQASIALTGYTGAKRFAVTKS